jgi:hypothetical protein
VEPARVVDLVDEARKIGCDIGEGFIGHQVYRLHFERFHEALGFGVVVGIARPAHAALKASLGEPCRVLARSVLDAAIGVVDEAGRRIARGDRLIERVHGQARLEMVVERPSHHSAREGVDDDGEIDESLRQPDIEPVLGLDPRMMSATHS